MQVQQLNMQYLPEADRVLFRIKTTNGEVMAFKLTRRFVRLLWPVIQDLIREDYVRRAPDKAQRPDVVEAMVDFERQSVMSRGDFRQPFAASHSTKFPLGERPILLSRIQVKKDGKVPVLCLYPTNGAGVELPANQQMLHFFSTLLKQVVQKAEWNLEIESPRPKLGNAGGTTLH